MTLLLLVRHALTDATGVRLSGQAPGFHLSAPGRAQAERLAARMTPLSLAAVYSSPLERCMETAEAVASPRGLEVRSAPGLIEVGYGSWTGRPLKQLARTALWKTVQQSPSSARFPNGESLAEVQRRSVDELDGLAAAHRKKTIAIFSHADVIRLALAHYAGLHLDLFQRLTVGTTSVSAVLLGDRIPRVLRVNDTGSLEDLAPRRPPSAGRRPAKRATTRGAARSTRRPEVRG